MALIPPFNNLISVRQYAFIYSNIFRLAVRSLFGMRLASQRTFEFLGNDAAAQFLDIPLLSGGAFCHGIVTTFGFELGPCA